MFFGSTLEKTSYSFSMWLVTLFVSVEKRSNSRSQKGFIEFLQSFLLRIFLVKVAISAVSYEFGHIYWRNPQWNPHILSSLTQMSWSPVIILFRNLCEDTILWTFASKILTFFIFLCYCFVFFHNYRVAIGSPCLFGTCFWTNLFSKCNFCTHYNVGSNSFLIESVSYTDSSW